VACSSIVFSWRVTADIKGNASLWQPTIWSRGAWFLLMRSTAARRTCPNAPQRVVVQPLSHIDSRSLRTAEMTPGVWIDYPVVLTNVSATLTCNVIRERSTAVGLQSRRPLSASI